MSITTTIPDEQLAQLVKEGNKLAFQSLFKRYWQKLYVAAYKALGDEAVCEDIVQDIFLDYWERAPRVQLNNVSAYLYQAVRYQVANHAKSVRFSEEREALITAHPSENSIEESIDAAEMALTIDASVSALPTKCREVFRLSRFENLSNKEIASRLGISVLTVETHIKKALKSLRRSMDMAG